MKPITPQQAKEQAGSHIPDFVVEAFNELITENLVNNTARITREHAINRIIKKNPVVTRNQLFNENWLDVEPLFRRVGWEVEYDQPGIGDSYESYYRFVINPLKL